MENQNPIWSRLWFVWAVLSAVYLALCGFFISARVDLDAWGPVYVVGLFVPFGFWNGLAGLGSLWGAITGNENGLIVPLATLAALFILVFGDYILQKYVTQNSVAKLIINLLILLFVTAMVDYAIWREWASWGLITGEFSP